LQQAQQFIKEKQWTMALRDLRAVIQAEPDHSNAHALLGVVYMHQKLQGMAKISFQQALKYDPQNSIALEYLPQVSDSGNAKDKAKKGGFFGWLGGGG
jgi:Tfp pilus assembly protein PilF